MMLPLLALSLPLAAAGWALLAWFFSGSFILALLIFVVLKLIEH